MNEIKAIFDDATNGNLPPSEWLGFVGYLLGKAFWPLAVIAIIGGAVALLVK